MYNTRTCYKNNFLHSTTIFVRGLHEIGLYDILTNFVKSSKEEISGLMHSYCTSFVQNRTNFMLCGRDSVYDRNNFLQVRKSFV